MSDLSQAPFLDSKARPVRAPHGNVLELVDNDGGSFAVNNDDFDGANLVFPFNYNMPVGVSPSFSLAEDASTETCSFNHSSDSSMLIPSTVPL